MFVENDFQDKNNNTDDTKTTASTGTSKSSTKTDKKLEPKATSTKVVKKKRADHDGDGDSGVGSLNNKAKRMKIETTVTVTVTIEPDDDIDSSEPIQPQAQSADPTRASSSLSSTSSSSTSHSTHSTASSDSAVVILDRSIDSNLSMNGDSIRSNRAADYNFDALNTDDDTDTEENTPHAPEWSKFANRNGIAINQTRVNTKVIDKFFGCRAESVDCNAIFPNSVPIRRRRSTAVWNTPPRYSTLPKY